MRGLWKFWERVRYKQDDLRVSTDGLLRQGQAELTIAVSSPDLMPDADFFLRFVVNYLNEAGARITAGQTLVYGYWLVKFQPFPNGSLDVWEYNAQATEFVPRGDLALNYWRRQRGICESAQADFMPPSPENLTSVSAGVMEGRPVEGVRYHSGEPMSGWIIVTDEYDGNIKSLRNEHTYHITAARPDLAKFLALPCGFRFSQPNGESVWWDKEVANQPPA
jgi:hypothetical protein